MAEEEGTVISSMEPSVELVAPERWEELEKPIEPADIGDVNSRELPIDIDTIASQTVSSMTGDSTFDTTEAATSARDVAADIAAPTTDTADTPIVEAPSIPKPEEIQRLTDIPMSDDDYTPAPSVQNAPINVKAPELQRTAAAEVRAIAPERTAATNVKAPELQRTAPTNVKAPEVQRTAAAEVRAPELQRTAAAEVRAIAPERAAATNVQAPELQRTARDAMVEAPAISKPATEAVATDNTPTTRVQLEVPVLHHNEDGYTPAVTPERAAAPIKPAVQDVPSTSPTGEFIAPKPLNTEAAESIRAPVLSEKDGTVVTAPSRDIKPETVQAPNSYSTNKPQDTQFNMRDAEITKPAVQEMVLPIKDKALDLTTPTSSIQRADIPQAPLMNSDGAKDITDRADAVADSSKDLLVQAPLTQGANTSSLNAPAADTIDAGTPTQQVIDSSDPSKGALDKSTRTLTGTANLLIDGIPAGTLNLSLQES